MNAPATVVVSALLAAGLAHSQSLVTGPGGSTENAVIIHAPPPVTAGRELRMSELPVSVTPPEFDLNYGTSGRYGPYPLTDGARIGNPQNPYTLRMFDYGAHFTLHSGASTNLVYGPFAATNGTLVTVGPTTFTLIRFPAKLSASIRHPDKINQMPTIGIAAYTPSLAKELYGLRAKYVALANRVDTETADVEFAGVPRIHSRITGNTFTPVVKKSMRDKQNTLKSAELSAVNFLETLFNRYFSIRSQAITEGSTYHFGMPAGDYILCAFQKVKDPAAQGAAGSSTALWWTAFTFDGEHSLALTLTAENAITWRELFTLDQAR